MIFQNTYEANELLSNGDLIVKQKKAQPCHLCRALTLFKSTGLELPVCSDECLDSLWESFYNE